MTPPAQPIVVVVSDATGETAEQAGKAALAQFGQQEESAVRTFSNVRTVEDLDRSVARAKELGGIVVYTLVDKELRTAIKDVGRLRQIAWRRPA